LNRKHETTQSNDDLSRQTTVAKLANYLQKLVKNKKLLLTTWKSFSTSNLYLKYQTSKNFWKHQIWCYSIKSGICCSWLHLPELLSQTQAKDGNSGH